MKILKTIMILLLTIPIGSFAQQMVKGVIVDEENKGVEFVTISVSQNGTILTGTTSDINGNFAIKNINESFDFIEISFTGKISQKIENKSAEAVIDLGQITLKNDAAVLDAVEVSTHRINIVRKVDRLVINVKDQTATAGATLYDLLLETPGVMLSDGENITVNGRSGLRLRIDDSDVPVPASQLNQVFKSIPASAMDAFELITKPSAQYEAEGVGAIILIRMKKAGAAGGNEYNTLDLQGSTSAGKTIYYGAGVTMRQGTKHSNTYLNYNFDKSNTYMRGKGKQEIADDYILNQDILQNMKDWNQGFNLGFDRNLSAGKSVGIKVNGNLNRSRGPIDNTTEYIFGTQDSMLVSNSSRGANEKLLSSNIHYIAPLDTTGKKITANIDYLIFDSEGDFNYNLSNINNITNESLLNIDNLRGSIYSGSIDYEQPLKKGDLKLGGKYSLADSESELEYYDSSTDILTFLEERSGKFSYKENIYALYSEYNLKHKMWDFQLGLRGEYTDYNSDVGGRSYFQLFPALYVQKMNAKGTILNLSYNRKIRRPGLYDLNPFEIIIDPFTYQRGNAMLQPEILNQLEFNAILKGAHVITAGWDLTEDANNQINTYDSDLDRIIFTSANLEQAQRYYLGLTSQFQINKVWSLVAKVEGNYNITQQDDYKNSGSGYYGFMMNRFVMKKGWEVQVIGQYTSSMRIQIFETKPAGMLIAKVAKNFDNGLSINISAVDILNTMRNNMSSDFGGFDFNLDQRFDIQRIKLGISYHIGKGEEARASKWERRKMEEAKRTGIK